MNSGRGHTGDISKLFFLVYQNMQDSTCVTAEQITVGGGCNVDLI